jgi:hypothetical protein
MITAVDYKFHSNMDIKEKQKSLMVSDKINILAQADAHIGPRIVLPSQLGLSVSTQNSAVKNHKKAERCYVQCDRYQGL